MRLNYDKNSNFVDFNNPQSKVSRASRGMSKEAFESTYGISFPDEIWTLAYDDYRNRHFINTDYYGNSTKFDSTDDHPILAQIYAKRDMFMHDAEAVEMEEEHESTE